MSNVKKALTACRYLLATYQETGNADAWTHYLKRYAALLGEWEALL